LQRRRPAGRQPGQRLITTGIGTRRSTAAAGHEEPPNDHSSRTEGQRERGVRSPPRGHNASPKQPRKWNGRPAAGGQHHTQRRQMASHPQMLQQLLAETDTDQRHRGRAPRPPHAAPRVTAARPGTWWGGEPEEEMGSQGCANQHDAPGRGGNIRMSRVQLAMRMPTPTRPRAKPMQTKRRRSRKHRTARNRARRTHARRLTRAPANPKPPRWPGKRSGRRDLATGAMGGHGARGLLLRRRNTSLGGALEVAPGRTDGSAAARLHPRGGGDQRGPLDDAGRAEAGAGCSRWVAMNQTAPARVSVLAR
jgi:hypothetical protein